MLEAHKSLRCQCSPRKKPFPLSFIVKSFSYVASIKCIPSPSANVFRSVLQTCTASRAPNYSSLTANWRDCRYQLVVPLRTITVTLHFVQFRWMASSPVRTDDSVRTYTIIQAIQTLSSRMHTSEQTASRITSKQDGAQKTLEIVDQIITSDSGLIATFFSAIKLWRKSLTKLSILLRTWKETNH
jgi:hypothetical protein